jgi:hypothetical protein
MLPVFNIFSSLFNWIAHPVDSTILTVIIFIVGYAAKKWLLPMLTTAARKKVAEYVLTIADDLTDWLVATYPEKDIWKYLDKAIDKLIEICGVSPEVAERALTAAMARKGLKKPE